MIFIFIGFIIGFVIEFKKLYYDGIYEAVSFGCFSALIGALIGTIICLFFSAIMYNSTPKEEYVSNVEYLQSFKDTSNINGSLSGGIFLMSGKIDEELNYRYIVNTDRGMIYKNIKANENTYIKYTTEKPKIETISNKSIISNKYFKYFFVDLFNGAYCYTVIYIPDGSITNEYNIDLK